MTWLDWLEIIFCGRSSQWMLRLSQALECKGFVRDLGMVMQKACFGCIPKGKYIEYLVYTKHFSREALCPFLSPETLALMDACTNVIRREMRCRMLSYTIDEVRDMSAAVTMAVTLDFEGWLADGQPVSVHIQEQRLIASLVADPTWYWKLERLTPVKG